MFFINSAKTHSKIDNFQRQKFSEENLFKKKTDETDCYCIYYLSLKIVCCAANETFEIK